MYENAPAAQARPGSAGSRVLVKVLVIVAALAALSLAISVGGKSIGRTIAMAGHTDDTTPRAIVIGGELLAIPANMIRFEDARRDGNATKIDLYLRWPTMDGYSQEARDEFNHVNDARSILFVRIEERMISRDMSGRLEPMYRSLIGEGRTGPAGLSVHTFTEKSGYGDELLVVGDARSARPFVMRCLAGNLARESVAPCERDIQIGDNLSLTYRMPAEIAGAWREVEAAVRAAADRFLKAGNAAP